MGFTRRVEDFTCAHCGAANRGDGYTNHCRACLWSRHVDVQPGDRAADCGGLMEPVGVEQLRGRWVLHHRCTVCGHQMRCRTADVDSTDALHEVARRAAEDATGRG